MNYKWQKEKWAKDVKANEHKTYLENWENDDKFPPTLANAITEGKYILRTFDEGGHTNNDMLTSEDKEEREFTRSEIREIKAFIKKYA